MNLDMGCGSHPGHKPREQEDYLHVDIRKTESNQDVLNMIADIQHLPFQSEVFEKVYAGHVLEHVPKPMQAIRELTRVCISELTIKVPHILSRAIKPKTSIPHDSHLCGFRRRHLAKIFRQYKISCRINHEPFMYFFLRPYEIELRVEKDRRKNS